MENEVKKLTLLIGQGEVGKPLLTILQKQDPAVIGIDIEPVAIDEPIGILHICFPFLEPAAFQRTVVEYTRKYKPEIVVVNSTVVPGTTRAIEKETGIPSVYSPIRGKHTKMVDDMYMYVKFVAGTSAEATARVQTQFLAAGLKSETMATPEALELAKLLETTYFGLLIAWGQEMNRFASTVGADYLDVGKFFREIGYLPNVLFQPGIIGGHCVMPNIALLEKRYQSAFLEVIKQSNEARKKELAGQEENKGERLQPLNLN
jgi:UDP-N-acetyl-D-mannosaminuronate dehydrogenase